MTNGSAVLKTLAATAAFALAARVHVGARTPSASPQAPANAACRVSGRATSGGHPLPGVSIAARSGAVLKAATSTDVDGAYRLALPAGTFSVAVELTGFTPVTREITLAPPGCNQSLDLELVLAPRAIAGAPLRATTMSPQPARRTAPANSPNRFEQLPVQADTTLEAADTSTTDRDASETAARLLLPPGFSTDAPTDALAINGNNASIDRGLMNERFGALGRGEFDPVTGEVAPGFEGAAQGPGGFQGPGGRGGRGGPGGGRGGFFLGGRGGRQNTFNLTTNYSVGGSALDAAPYQLHPESPTPKTPYSKQTFGLTMGGPLKIPHVYDGSRKTFFIASYTGNRGRTLFDQFANVPTAAERAGDFSALARPIIDPATGLPFPDNQIPSSALNPGAATLLRYVPLPNVPGSSTSNFHRTTTTASSLDNVNLRVIQNFTPAQANGRGGFGGFGRGGGGRFGGGGRGRQGTNVVLTAQLQYRRNSADQPSVFPTLGGTSAGSSLAVPVTLNVVHKGMLHNLTVNFSRTRSSASNQYAYLTDIAGAAGIAGVSTDPFDWGLPTLSIAGLSTLRDLTPSSRTDRRVSAAYRWTKFVNKHVLRAGGDVRFDRSASEMDQNPRGTFVFTGVYSDLPFADFLLGAPQQASVQYGPGLVTLNGRSMGLFVQDDWRKTSTLTFNIGLRYEVLWPFTEAQGHMANLDVAPDFTAAVPVVAGGTGPFTGAFPKGLMQTDVNNLAPRLGMAWRIRPGMVLRGGYGVSYNSGTYSTIARELAGQPPFATAATAIGTFASPLALLDPFAAVAASETSNTYGVSRNYNLGRVQTWNVDFSRDLTPVWNVGAGYTEIRGANLDIVRAPNRGPNGLRIPDVQPFLWQASDGSSVLHAGTFRLQRRASHGIGGSLVYTLGRSRDNASTVGGGATVVAQNDQDLNAEWGLSSFDRRHQLAANVSIELPFGPNRRWLSGGGAWATLLDNWRVAGTYTFQSGTPLTPLVLASASDVARGTNGTLRANYSGGDIQLPSPTVTEFFNTAAFSLPAAGTFGTAGRNIIIGPSTAQLNAQLARDLRYGRTHSVTLDLIATNVLNTVNFGAVDTYVNSPTFGQVLSVRPRRTVVFNVRFRY